MDSDELRFGGLGRRRQDRTEATTRGQYHGRGSWWGRLMDCQTGALGVGRLILVDLDDVCVSNTNRQLHAKRPSETKDRRST